MLMVGMLILNWEVMGLKLVWDSKSKKLFSWQNLTRPKKDQNRQALAELVSGKTAQGPNWLQKKEKPKQSSLGGI